VTESFKNKAEQHALEIKPKESCGVVVNGQYWRCRNIADNPEDDFVLDPRDYAMARTFGSIEAIVHSHPQGGPASEGDLKSQRQSKITWYIFSIPENQWLTINP
jgi:proteasome lid subunit RPN8/RPN11